MDGPYYKRLGFFGFILLSAVALFFLPGRLISAGETQGPTETSAPTPAPTSTETIEREPLIYNEYTVSLEYVPEDNSISGFERVRYKNNTNSPLHKISFNLYFNAFSETSPRKPYLPSNRADVFPYGEDYGEINIINTFVNGAVCRHSVSGTVLTVYLPFVLQKEQEASIDIHFYAHIPMVALRTGANEEAVWMGNFIPVLAVFDKTEQQWRNDPYYPLGRPFYSNIANYTVRVTTPAEYNVVGAGDVTVTGMGVKKTTAMTAARVREFAFAISGDYAEKMVKESAFGVYVRIIMYSQLKEETLEWLAKTVTESVDYFTEKIGGYPYKALKITENGNYVNMSVYPQVIFINTNRILTDDPAETAASLAMGVAKQWFYGVVGSDGVNEAWLSEGLSCYLSQMFVYRDDEDGLKSAMDALRGELSETLAGFKHTRLSDDISVYGTLEAYVAVQTHKGALMFNALRERMGNEEFDKFLRLYYSGNYLMIATRDSLIKAAEEVCGQSQELTDFFTEWLYGEGLPSGL